MTAATRTEPTREQAALRAAWSHGTGKEVTVDPGLPEPGTRLPLGRPLADLAALVPGGAVIGAVLEDALAPTRWDDWSNYNAHHAYPSPRAKQAHRAELVLDDGVHPVDETRASFGAVSGAAGAAGPGPALLLHAAPERIPAGYGPMRQALALLELGHVVQAVLDAAGSRGCPLAWTASPDAASVRIDLNCRPTRSVRSAADRMAAAGTGSARVRRCSGLDPRGLTADPRPLPAATWQRLVAAGPRSDDRLTHRLAVRGVQGIEEGIWQLPPAGGPELVRAGSVARQLAAAFRGPPGTADIAGMNTVWTVSADVAAQVRRRPEAYAHLLVRAGMAAQIVCGAAAACGLFARPVRGVEEPDVEAALGLPPGVDLLYVLLIGRPIVHGFTYDLTVCRTRPDLGDLR